MARKHKIYLSFLRKIFNECSHVLPRKLSDTIASEILQLTHIRQTKFW